MALSSRKGFVRKATPLQAFSRKIPSPASVSSSLCYPLAPSLCCLQITNTAGTSSQALCTSAIASCSPLPTQAMPETPVCFPALQFPSPGAAGAAQGSPPAPSSSAQFLCHPREKLHSLQRGLAEDSSSHG